MGNLLIRNLPDEVHNQIKLLAAKHERSLEAEVRSLLTTAINREVGGGLGSTMRAAWGNNLGDDFEAVRSTDMPREVTF